MARSQGTFLMSSSRVRLLPEKFGSWPRSQVEQEMECPFYSAGLFLENEVDGECEDEFMSIAPRSLPGCDKHCCTLQHSSGAAHCS